MRATTQLGAGIIVLLVSLLSAVAGRSVASVSQAATHCVRTRVKGVVNCSARGSAREPGHAYVLHGRCIVGPQGLSVNVNLSARARHPRGFTIGIGSMFFRAPDQPRLHDGVYRGSAHSLGLENFYVTAAFVTVAGIDSRPVIVLKNHHRAGTFTAHISRRDAGGLAKLVGEFTC